MHLLINAGNGGVTILKTGFCLPAHPPAGPLQIIRMQTAYYFTLFQNFFQQALRSNLADFCPDFSLMPYFG
jgi:hypothetical protein